MADTVKQPEKSPGMLKREANLKKFTPMTAKEASALAAKAKQMRKQMRAKLLETAIDEGIEKYFAKALKNMDAEGIAVVEKAARLVGLDFASSEESVQRVDVKSDNKVDSKLEVTISGVE
jgi:hypothetical protein